MWQTKRTPSTKESFFENVHSSETADPQQISLVHGCSIQRPTVLRQDGSSANLVLYYIVYIKQNVLNSEISYLLCYHIT